MGRGSVILTATGFYLFIYYYLTKFRIVSAILILSFRKNHFFLYFECIIFMYFNEINEKRLTIFE